MAFWTIFLKDLRLELRTKESLSAMVVFAAAVILLFAFAFEAAPARFQSFMPGLMWMTYFFTAVLGLFRSVCQMPSGSDVSPLIAFEAGHRSVCSLLATAVRPRKGKSVVHRQPRGTAAKPSAASAASRKAQADRRQLGLMATRS